jgi:hypothetical protein
MIWRLLSVSPISKFDMLEFEHEGELLSFRFDSALSVSRKPPLLCLSFLECNARAVLLLAGCNVVKIVKMDP